MPPKVVVIAGPLRGATYELSSPELLIGRSSACGIAVSDPLLSRHHACLANKEGQIWLIDLNSRNGVFVNGLPIQKRLLKNGDHVVMGRSFMVYLNEEESPDLDEKGEEASLNATQSRTRTETKEDLFPQIIATALELVPADRAALFLASDERGFLQFACSWDRRQSSPTPFEVDPKIIHQAFHEAKPVVHNQLASAGIMLGNGQILNAQLCVPFVSPKPIGVLYLDTTDELIAYSPRDIKCAMAVADLAAVAVKRLWKFRQMVEDQRKLQAELETPRGMVGESQAMQQVYQFVNKVAKTDSTVLILGESGTGKELVARELHANSPRASQPFVAVNCASLVENLLESELFGHEKGAFTGAISTKKGKFEVANGGTLFLDEIGELPLSIQARLLRALQERQIDRVGGLKPIKVNIRIIAATNRDLERQVKLGDFRQDLFFRLNVLSVTMPPLRERRQDIPLLANYFTAKFSRDLNRKMVGVTPDARRYLMNYDWPGNVRELQNAIEHAVVLGGADSILPEDLPESILEKTPVRLEERFHYHEAVTSFKRQLVQEAILKADGNYLVVAEMLGVHPNYLYRLVKNLDLKLPKTDSKGS
ncbi:MAG TPA: sigma 54-interacting transcriptional regulator [Acidobacteriota bacterium]|nr:sigma 54-interacting transcriptional regulator [Acidobacteriota bacterium]HND18430.1 sigma 54-interacting transcriptional regulator [Acidobacteriota bacterium]